MAKPNPNRRWHRFRVIFRRCRIVLLLVALALAAALLYLNCVGLPDFVKKPLLEKLHARGLDLQFSRLRWRPIHGIVVENVFFGHTNDVSSPALMLREIQVKLDYVALLRRQFQVNSLALREGRLVWPVVETNGPARELSLENIRTDLQLRTNDVWELNTLQAEFAGGHIQLTGAITNASAIRDWKLFHSTQPTPPGALQNRLRRLADTLEKIHFATAPELKLDIRGDARDVENIAVRLSFEAPDADTPWGVLNQASCSILLAPPKTNELSRAEVKLRAVNAATRWASVTNVVLTAHLVSIEGDTNLVHAELDLTADSAQRKANRADNIHLTAQWLHSRTNVLPLSGRIELHASNATNELTGTKQLRLTAQFYSATNAPQTDASWAWWTSLAPYALDLECAANGVQSPKFSAEEIFSVAQWRAPDFSIKKLSVKLYGGSLDANAKLNIPTREVTFSAVSSFDAQKISPLLTPVAQEWLTNYSWNKPPQVQGTGALILPGSVWTNRNPDWRAETRPTLRLNGQFHTEDGAFRGVRALTADSHFSYSNMCWLLPDLVAVRREGRVNLFLADDDRTHDFYFRVHSTMDVRAVRPLLETNQQRGFDLATFTQPPVIDAEIWGRWHDHERIGARARVAVTNFSVRGESADNFQTELTYTNRILKLIKPRLQCADAQEISATSVDLVFDHWKIFITNGIGHADPGAITRAIGPNVARAIEPYRFLRPPDVRVEGVIPMRSVRDADLHFDVDGSDFQYWKLGASHISGKIDWVGEKLWLKDVQASFYRGNAVGSAEFDFRARNGADFKLNIVATDADLHSLTEDLYDGKTNKLEGLLTARLEVFRANSKDWQSLQGTGRVNLRDGLIWEIPIFGLFSPVLDTIMPGLGSSRAREGSATFAITNGVVSSDDLKIETMMARLKYWGSIDLKGDVNARMEAELFHNTWVIGPVVSLALWPVSKTFEYQITGTIHEPKSEPVFVPKILFLPLHPIQTIKEMMPEQTNSPPTAIP